MFSFNPFRRRPADSSASGRPESAPTDQRGEEPVAEDSAASAREGATAESSKGDPGIAMAVVRGACEGLGRKAAEKIWNFIDH